MFADEDSNLRACEVVIGFDSAWTDNQRKPGAITAYVRRALEAPVFFPPTLATFDQALKLATDWSLDATYVLLAIDQPTIVPNDSGCRPVDRVAGSLVSRLGGGVQPARRGGTGAPMFGEGAPIWHFLATVGAIENPIDARDADTGRYVMEVFPALALPTIVPEIWRRRHAAKYNPAARNFVLADWQMITSGVATFARNLEASDLAAWIEQQSVKLKPVKADQDRLDAAICLSIALSWRRRGSHEATLVIGDERSGYMATVASPEIRSVLVKSALQRGVPIDQKWDTAVRSAIPGPPIPAQLPTQVRLSTPEKQQSPRTRLRRLAMRPSSVDPDVLRALLIDRARKASPITYGEVATALGTHWNQGFGTSLTRALNTLAAHNTKAGEPLLMCLVVNKETRLPGKGYYATTGQTDADFAMQRKLFDDEVRRCQNWQWK